MATEDRQFIAKCDAETQVIRSGHKRTAQNEHNEAIFMTSSYRFESAAEAEEAFAAGPGYNVYSRFSNPNVDTFGCRLAALEGVRFGLGTASGMSAIHLLFMTMLKQGDHVVASASLFGSTMALMNNVLKKFGVEISFVTLSDIDSWQQAVRGNTRLFFLETPSNPLCELVDLKALSDVAKPHGIKLVVDNCFCTPILQRPAAWGADVVVHSGTKYLDGQGRCIGGALTTDDEDLFNDLYSYLKFTGAALSPFNAWLLSKSLETLGLRMEKHSDNAIKVARWLETQPQVARVYYPGLKSHPQHELAKKQQNGFGGMVSFEIKGDQQAAWSVVNRMKMVSVTGNFGDARSTLTHPYTTTHGRLSVEEKHSAGIRDNLLRLSVGLESADDVIADLDQAMN